MTLGEKQRTFARLVGLLLGEIYKRGFEASFGDAFRDPKRAAELAAQGIGIANSLHTQRLAIDLNLFRDGKLLTDTESHRQFGEWWEAQSVAGVFQCAWGGRFKRPDGNHYSIAHAGRR